MDSNHRLMLTTRLSVLSFIFICTMVSSQTAAQAEPLRLTFDATVTEADDFVLPQ